MGPISQKVDSLYNENWHALEENTVCEKLASSKTGLDLKEAVDRLAIYGPNTLPLKDSPNIWQVLLRQVKNPLIFILIAAAIASLAIGEKTDAIFIIIIIGLNSGLGAYQEYNAEKSAASLQNLLKISARIRRGNKEFEIPSEELVPGDIVLLESGNKVPADLRLFEANNLSADESFLTGESVAATKRTSLLPQNVGVSERKNIAYAGSTVVTGRGLGIVVSTGMKTEVGRIAEHVNESESAKPPLVRRMENFTRQISIMVLFVSIILAIILHLQGLEAADIFFFVVALAVSAIPEGLPVALTVALSIAVSRMSKRNVIVRKLPTVESLGSCTVIASDKTGTLTVNQQTARQVFLPDGQRFNISGQGYNGEGEFTAVNQAEVSAQAGERLRRLSELAMLANEGSLTRENGEWVHYGDAMDVAFLAMGYKLGIDSQKLKSRIKLLGMIPYESERKFSAAFYRKAGLTFISAKGAVETILEFCNLMQYEDRTVDLDRVQVEKQAEEMAVRGYRVLA
ncbi:MAG: ATPase, P-type (Transporting), HAD superfamily, subfamily IC, partial [Pelotomaculum thermopropionicum]